MPQSSSTFAVPRDSDPLDPDGVLAALVADAPPLTQSQRSRIALLVRAAS